MPGECKGNLENSCSDDRHSPEILDITFLVHDINNLKRAGPAHIRSPLTEQHAVYTFKPFLVVSLWVSSPTLSTSSLPPPSSSVAVVTARPIRAGRQCRPLHRQTATGAELNGSVIIQNGAFQLLPTTFIPEIYGA